MAADGSDAVQVTNHPADDNAPDWSPDGRRLVFQSSRDRDAIAEQIRQVYVMDADGTDQRAITAGPSENGHARWGQTRP